MLRDDEKKDKRLVEGLCFERIKMKKLKSQIGDRKINSKKSSFSIQ